MVPVSLPGRWLVLLALLLSSCSASGPQYAELGVTPETVPAGKARIVFFRTGDTVLYIARRAAISIDGKKVAATPHGGFHYHDVDAGSHTLRADMWDLPGKCELTMTLAPAQTYYFQVDPRAESFGAFAAGDFITQLLAGNPVISVAGGVGAVAAESYREQCGGAFRLYPVDAATANARLATLKYAR